MDVPKVREHVWDHRFHKHWDPGLLTPLGSLPYSEPHRYLSQIILNLKYQAGCTESEVSSTTSQENYLMNSFIQ